MLAFYSGPSEPVYFKIIYQVKTTELLTILAIRSVK